MKAFLAGGGTLGPVTALLAVAEVLRDRGMECVFVGTRSGPDGPFVRAAGFEHRTLPVAKLRRGFSLSNLRLPLDLARAYRRAAKLIQHESPSVVVSAGGFTAVPLGWAAHRRGIPLVLHQQDVRLSLSNRLLASRATRITAALPASVMDFSGLSVSVTGNPVRASMFGGDGRKGMARFGFDSSRPLLVVIGGGTGSARLNLLVVAALPELLQFTQVLHVVAHGRGLPALERMGYRSVPALTLELPDVFAAASVLLCRSGFGTLSEVAQRDTPALVVPMPHSHQEANARVFEAAGAITVAAQSELGPLELVRRVRNLLDADRAELARRRTPFHWRGAASAVADVVMEASRHGK
jgi:UDP-N-acetylglucosamine--N-acetylmuramyl-(pentapeptide) pyrophosphoryl-undecaprenol N-acetylglucosamine transferase